MEEKQHKSPNDPSIVDDFMYGSNVAQAHIYIRMGFLRKVYGILTVQLLVTAAFGYACFHVEYLEGFFKSNPWTLLAVIILSFGLLIALHVKRHETPINFILLGLFTLCEAFLCGIIATQYEATTVVQAALITFGVTGGLTLFTLQSKRDFSKMGSALMVFLFVLIMASIVEVFLWSAWFDLIISVAGALVFSGFIVFDTHMLMHKLSPEEYIAATITLYLDIINLFLYILRILNAAKRN